MKRGIELKQKKRDKGFTLVELLATILIISITLGIGTYFAINTISNSENKSQKLTHESLMTGARIYVQENPKKIKWLNNEAKIDEQFSCISVKTLINQNIIKKESIENPKVEIPQYIIVTKNKNSGNIISEKADTNGKNEICNNTQIIEIPTSEKNCKKSITYTPNLINPNITITEHLTTNDNNPYTFKYIGEKEKNNSTNTFDAGNYKFEAILNEGYIWEDGTTESIPITCTIRKATPVLALSPNGTSNAELANGALTSKLTSDVPGTIAIKSSNKDYVTATPSDDNYIIDKEKEIIIQPLSTRKTNTIITITLSPEDQNNYYTNSTTYTIDDIEKTAIPNPTKEQYCKKNNYYDGEVKNLINPNSTITGFKFVNTTGINIGTHVVTAILKYGYIWEDGTLENKTIDCEIKSQKVEVNYDSNGGTTCNPNAKTVNYMEKYGTLCLPQKDNNLFLGWYTKKEGGKKISEQSTVTAVDNHTLYAHWKKVSCTINYSGTSGKNDWYTSIGQVSLSISNMSGSEIRAQNITSNSQKPFTKLSNTTQNETKGTTWYGYVKDINNHTITCQKTIKVDTTAPTTPIIENKTNENWVNYNFSLTTKTTETISGVEYWQYKYNNVSPVRYENSNTEQFETTDFTKERNELVYLKACDYAGNCSTESSTYIRIDKTAPSCTNSGGKASWTNQNITLTGTCSDKASGCVSNISKLYTTDTNTTTASPGNVKDNAGNTTACPANQTVKIDKTRPTITNIVNPTNGAATSNPFSLNLYGNDNLSGIAYWQYKYSNTDWNTYPSSNANTFTTTPFLAIRNELVYIRNCDNAGNCSNEGSTKIYIVQACSETNYTACQKMYICKSNDPDKLEETATWIRTNPSFSNTDGHAVTYTSAMVYSISTHTDSNGNIFHKVYIPEDSKSSFYPSWKDIKGDSRIGYIYKGCLRTTKPTSSNNNSWCWDGCDN